MQLRCLLQQQLLLLRVVLPLLPRVLPPVLQINERRSHVAHPGKP